MRTELDKVVAALKAFYAHEAFLFEHDLGERALTHRLALHMERQFPDFDVHCDFARLGPRTLNMPRGSIVSTDDHLGKSIYPDIVVHQRSVPNNLIAIEVRKAGNHQPLEHDRQSLAPLTDPHIWFAYWIGILLTLGKNNVASAEIYASGKHDPEMSRVLAGLLKEADIGAA